MPLPLFLAPAAIGGMLKRFWPLLLVALFGIILLLAFCEGKKAGKGQADLARERGNVEAQKQKAKADENAATRRRQDDSRLNAEESALKGVRENAKNPSDRRLARHRCLREQQQARAAHRPAPVC